MLVIVVERSYSIPSESSQRVNSQTISPQFRHSNRSQKKNKTGQKQTPMKQITNICSLRCFSVFFSTFLVLFVSGLADTPSTSDGKIKNAASKKSSGSSTTATVLLVLLALLAVGAFSAFLYKTWQRKKREEQHARLLKLFEQDDELEVELGMRD